MVTDYIVCHRKKPVLRYLLFFVRSNRFAAEQPPVIDMSRCIEYSAPISSVIWWCFISSVHFAFVGLVHKDWRTQVRWTLPVVFVCYHIVLRTSQCTNCGPGMECACAHKTENTFISFEKYTLKLILSHCLFYIWHFACLVWQYMQEIRHLRCDSCSPDRGRCRVQLIVGQIYSFLDLCLIIFFCDC